MVEYATIGRVLHTDPQSLIGDLSLNPKVFDEELEESVVAFAPLFVK